MTKDNKHIKEIWDDIIEGAEVLEDKIDGYGDILKRRKLSDGTIIQLRKKSSGGAKAKKRWERRNWRFYNRNRCFC